MIINFKMDDEYEIIINMNNVLYIRRQFDSPGYVIMFSNGEVLGLTWREFDRLVKAIENH